MVVVTLLSWRVATGSLDRINAYSREDEDGGAGVHAGVNFSSIVDLKCMYQ
jgi:hypothetical protein